MSSRKRASWWLTPVAVLVGLAMAVPVTAKPRSSRHGKPYRVEKLDKELKSRSGQLFGTSRVIITIKPGQESNAVKEIGRLGGRTGRRLQLVNGMSVELPNRVIKMLSERSEVVSIHYDRPIASRI